jgi:ribosome biogenesis GTPase
VDFGSCLVTDPVGEVREATVPGRLRGPRKVLGNAVVVGDAVSCLVDSGRVVIQEVRPRRNLFSRRASGRLPAEQVVAANLDQVVVIASLQEPEFKPGLVDRVLAQAEHAGIPGRLVLSKCDLGSRAEADGRLGDYGAAGYAGHRVSAFTGEGVEDLVQACRGHRSLFVGHSGTGKSTLLNAMIPGLDLLAGHVNAKTGRGRHTTTAAWLLRPEPGFELIDTPGVRVFGLWGIGPGDLDRAYPEFRPYLGRCRFGDCGHDREPGCAVRAAADSGAIARRRLDSYLKLRDELAQEVKAMAPRSN